MKAFLECNRNLLDFTPPFIHKSQGAKKGRVEIFIVYVEVLAQTGCMRTAIALGTWTPRRTATWRHRCPVARSCQVAPVTILILTQIDSTLLHEVRRGWEWKCQKSYWFGSIEAFWLQKFDIIAVAIFCRTFPKQNQEKGNCICSTVTLIS